MKVKHTLKPIYDESSKVLILGSLPSVKSREIGFYYGHPKNRFWSTLEKVFEEKIGNSKEEKINFLKKHHIALFDVVKECDISQSSDASIKNIIPNNLKPILKNSNIKTIFTTGTKAHELYKKYIYPKRTKKLSKLNSPWSSPSKFPASQTRYPYFSTGLTSDSRYRSFLLFLSFLF